ncbi:methyl-accepting chemotaxis protein [Chromobacterium sp. LK1]|uniref:methyl-accepting chemotaxis protein n=1 Tax=Chromobacterium sp. LK1 TaxID=1628193 RepID=UPI00069E3145|nr:methyl-accepting chemotaxis protein [Chromobacterium sp. LK1]
MVIIVAAVAAALLMALLCWWVARSMLPPIEHFKDAAQRIERSGDLSIRAPVGRNDELGAAIGEFNTLMDTLQGIVGKVGQTSGALGGSVDEIAQLTLRVGQASQQQTDSAQSMAGAIQQLADHLASVAEHADSTLQIAGEVGQCSSEGSRAVQQTVGNIGNLAQTIHHSANSVQLLEGDIRKIGGMVNSIRGIADQTNLLALNAAIEAARAGESGRGFAVVADEVRALAERTAQATADIVNVISQLQATSEQVVSGMENGVGQVEEGVELVKQLGGMVDQIGRQAGVAEERIRNISRLLDNQKAAGAQILVNVDAVTEHAGTTSRSVEQVQDELLQLRGHFGELSESIRHMRV